MPSSLLSKELNVPTLNGFNANDVDPNFAFEAIPAGKYLAAITECEMKPTKSKRRAVRCSSPSRS